MSDKWTKRAVWLEIHRAAAITLVGWAKRIWPSETDGDRAVHASFAKVGKAAMLDLERGG